MRAGAGRIFLPNGAINRKMMDKAYPLIDLKAQGTDTTTTGCG